MILKGFASYNISSVIEKFISVLIPHDKETSYEISILPF